MNKEEIFLKIINNTLSDNSFLGDDCAFLKDEKLLISHDSFIEDIHFSCRYFSPRQIGKKALLVNISDIIAGGGMPKYLTISLSGRLNENFVKEFYIGIDEICKKYNLKVIGGDLTGGDKIAVSICIFGTADYKISSLKNAKEGDNIFLKGFHGSSAKGLLLLQNGVLDYKNEFIKAHIEPKIYADEALLIAKNAKFDFAMTDTSDGLYIGLKRISALSKIGFDINYSKIPKKIDDKKLVIFGGEDFGLLVCLNPKDSYIAENAGFSKIGTARGCEILFDGKPLNDESFCHF